MSHRQTPKPDDRSNNVERLQQMVENTRENIEEAEISKEFADPEQAQQIKEKNKRRKQSIDALIEEVKDETAARKKGYR
ncbi:MULTISPECIES: small acid-soluble spore protein Tlp [Rummeliibacillus]|jgi:small acid-soluble spore protein (thioredoxin-like protein)|uniref:small acid-soluble spore protein Tlp n=1 Tax=Rummeliibacillus TaxID=648802 RepID=UPI0011B80CB5|nr:MULTISPECIES: small acid-soluble spore protein Tlp [Rummeliibacillus]MBO2537115.1 small acid-soluble spore protein Tlp [Rummeliibacillus suwonensis]